MKTAIFTIIFLSTIIGCENMADTERNKPTITVINVFGNDAIDATVEYSVTGEHETTYLVVDGNRIDAARTGQNYTATFPAKGKERIIVAENGEAIAQTSF